MSRLSGCPAVAQQRGARSPSDEREKGRKQPRRKCFSASTGGGCMSTCRQRGSTPRRPRGRGAARRRQCCTIAVITLLAGSNIVAAAHCPN